jgi:hypothetical protein
MGGSDTGSINSNTDMSSNCQGLEDAVLATPRSKRMRLDTSMEQGPSSEALKLENADSLARQNDGGQANTGLPEGNKNYTSATADTLPGFIVLGSHLKSPEATTSYSERDIRPSRFGENGPSRYERNRRLLHQPKQRSNDDALAECAQDDSLSRNSPASELSSEASVNILHRTALGKEPQLASSEIKVAASTGVALEHRPAKSASRLRNCSEASYASAKPALARGQPHEHVDPGAEVAPVAGILLGDLATPSIIPADSLDSLKNTDILSYLSGHRVGTGPEHPLGAQPLSRPPPLANPRTFPTNLAMQSLELRLSTPVGQPLPPPPQLWVPILLPDPMPPYRLGSGCLERESAGTDAAACPLRMGVDSRAGMDSSLIQEQGEAGHPDPRHYFAVTRDNFTNIPLTMINQALEVIGAPMSGLRGSPALSIRYLERYFEAVRQYPSHCIYIEREKDTNSADNT